MNIRRKGTSLVFTFALVSLISVGSTLTAQHLPLRQARGQNSSEQAPQLSNNGNTQTSKEIEMMKEMVRERKEQQAQQRQLLEELQDALYQNQAPTKTTTTYQQTGQQPTPSSPAVQTGQRVTSGSVLSQLEHQEREEYKDLERQYNADIRKADREIDFLRKQLEIANNQLSQCQTMASTTTRATPEPVFEPAQQQSRAQAGQKASKAKSSKKVSRTMAKQVTSNAPQPVAAKPKVSDTDAQAMKEIEEMKAMLRERRQQADTQQQMLRDLQMQLPR